MSVYVLDTAYEAEESGGILANRVVVRGTRSGACKYPAAAHSAGALGASLDSAAQGRALAVRRLGIARLTAAAAILADSPVCIADAQGRVKAAARASGVTGTVGANNAILWTAREYSAAGNALMVDIVVAGQSTALAVSVSGNTITIASATNSGGAATTTAAQAIAAVAAHAAARLLVSGANESTSNGSGAIADESAIFGGGGQCLNILGIAEESAAAEGDIIDVLLTP